MSDEPTVGTPDAPSSTTQLSDSDRTYAEAVRRATESSGAPPAPWESAPNSWEPPRGPDGTPRYAAYQDAPTSAAPPPRIPQPSNAAYSSFAPAAAPVGFAVEDPEADRSKVKGFVGLALALVLAGMLIFEFVPGNVSAPDSFTKYVSSDGRFSCDVPVGWSLKSTPAESTDKSAIGGMLDKAGAARIDVTSDTVASLRASILLNSSAALPDGMFNDPVDQLHNADRAHVAATMKDYAEQAPQSVETGLGSALVSEFTGKGGFLGLGGPMHGYRASMADGDYTFEVVLQCPDKSWSDLKATFERVIKSMGPGEGGVFSPMETGKQTDFGNAGTPVQSDQGDASTLTQPKNTTQPGNPNLPTVGYGGAAPPDTAPDAGGDTTAPAGDGQ